MSGSELTGPPGDAPQRNKRGDEVADAAGWKGLLDDASQADLWDGVRRHERADWKDWLDAADKLTARPRNTLPQVFHFHCFMTAIINPLTPEFPQH